MFIGQTLCAENFLNDENTLTKHESVVYTPWFPRGGNSGVFQTEVIVISHIADDTAGSDSYPTLEMTVQTKNTEDTDSTPGDVTDKGSATYNGNSTGSTMKVDSSNAAGLEELVRVKFRLYDAGGGTAMSRCFYATFRLLNPSWVTN